MTDFEGLHTGALLGSLGISNADAVLDLRKVTASQADESVKDLIERSLFLPRRAVAIRLSPPPDGGGETLFLPVGRQLLAARRRGWIARMSPLPAHDGLGYFVVFPGRDPGAAESND